MSNDVTCPHCQVEFDVFDHHESGEYECPECGKQIWIEVEYTPYYEASCLPSDHEWEKIQSVYRMCEIDHCSKCGEVKIEDKSP